MWGVELSEKALGKREAERPLQRIGMGSLQDCRGGCNLQCFRNCRIAESLGATGAANVRAMQRKKNAE